MRVQRTDKRAAREVVGEAKSAQVSASLAMLLLGGSDVADAVIAIPCKRKPAPRRGLCEANLRSELN